MNEQMTTLKQSCEFFNGKAHEKDIDKNGKYVVVNSKFISSNGEKQKFTSKQMFPLYENDIVMVMSDVPNGKALAKCYIVEKNDRYSLNQRICAIRTTEFDIKFLYYQLNRNPYFLAFNNGENQTNLRKGDILKCPLWKPVLKVQQKIVTLLDEAFADIQQAQANIEQNIVNAKELFQSKLNEIFSQRGEGWEEAKYGEVIKMKSGHNLTAKKMIKGDFPVYGGNGIAGYHNSYNIEGENIIIGRVGALCGNVRFINESIWLTDNAFKISKLYYEFDLEFLTYLLNYIDLRSYARQAAQPVISNSSLKNVGLRFPIDKNIQIKIRQEIKMIEEKVNQIFKPYQQKLQNLEELKKSLLEKAFQGALTRDSITAS